MGLFDNFPYTNFHELNLMWILEALKEIQTTTEQFVAINSLKYADPIQWNIVSQYEKNTIVIDPLTGTAYISVQPVPSGVIITNTDYWSVVFDLGSFVVRAAKNFTSRWEADTTLTATFPTNTGDWLVWGDTLYKALVNITAGDQYVIGSNIEHFTMEELIGHSEDLTTDDKSNLIAAINELLQDIHFIQSGVTWSNQHDNVNYDLGYGANAFFWWHNILYRTTTSVNIGDTITEGTNCQLYTVEHVLTSLSGSIGTIVSNIGSLLLLNTTDKSSIVNAINEVLSGLGDVTTITVPASPDTVTAINKAWTRILQVEHRVDMYHRVAYKKAILISDSYGVASDSWPYQFETITGMDCDVYAYSGCGFYTNQVNSILSNFQNETFTDAQKAEVTDIIACLGANDIATCTAGDITSLISEIGNFVTYCKSNFPNAEIFIGMCGYVLYGYPAAGTGSVVNYLNVLAAYQLGASQADAYYLSGVEFPLHYYYNISFIDGIHPSNAGKTALARAIAGAWKNGSYSYKGDGAYLFVTPITGIQIDGSSDPASLGLAYIEDEITWLAMNKRIRVVASPALSIGDTFVKIADITTPRSFYANGTEYEIPITAQAVMSDIDGGKIVNVPMILQFKNGELNIKSLYINSGVFETHTYTTMYLTLTNQQIMTLAN